MIKIISFSIFFGLLVWFLIFMKYTEIAIVLAIAAVIWFFVFLKKKQDQLEESFQKRFAGRNIRYLDKHAVLRAQQSNGYSQSQGMGYLVLTDDELYFEMTLLSITISIPASSLIKAEKIRRLLGVNPIRPMLKVEFIDSNGKDDAIALNVKETENWIDAISKLIHEQA